MELRGAVERGQTLEQLLDYGAGQSFTWSECCEKAGPVLGQMTKNELQAVLVYQTAQLVGARHSVDADALLAVNQVETIITAYRERRARG